MHIRLNSKDIVFNSPVVVNASKGNKWIANSN